MWLVCKHNTVLAAETYDDAVSSAWTSGNASLLAIHSNLSGLQRVLTSWEREQFGSVRRELGPL
jgi:hypothetical protein